ncbi:MAG: hypothetical protein FWB97_04305 [Oscillospiraceae bacterium]|nr:hypothetical protein [Oscillospiraceae bacterium]
MLFNRNIEPSCAYCRFSSALGRDEFACSKRGIMTSECSCSSFRYEPTKRVPEPMMVMRKPVLTEEEFTL